ncbi:cuticle protein 16.8 [Galendromus occidentalis]|uniref:Cuticle protein 16.8 n=1 Tax=Galendromus occidentalis TaxID=34638 RepID=A0AAJ6QJT5_9ACAR|nr:cuticle protein 16.8 [Galendromus occidentalis]
MRLAILAVAVTVASANAQGYREEVKYDPIPYQFAYKAESNEGSNSHEETSDGNGRVQGSYSFSLADGRERTVTYWADESGFHADVKTNELGTETKDASDAKYSSSAITGEQAAVQYGAQVQAEQKTKIYQDPAPIVNVRATPAPVKIHTVPAVFKSYEPVAVIKYAAAAPTVYKTVQAVQASPTVIKTIQAASPVYKTIQAAPTIFKTIGAAPISYAYAHAPVSYTQSASPFQYVPNDYNHVIQNA